MNRTARALVSLYALLCLLAGVCVPALHAADTGGAGWAAADRSAQSADAPRPDRPGDAPAPEPHDHPGCVLCHADHGTPALPEAPAAEVRPGLIATLYAPCASPARASEPHVSLPPSRAPPRG